MVVSQITPKISAKKAGTKPAIPDIQTLNANAVTILRIKKINPEKIINNVRKILDVYVLCDIIQKIKHLL